MKLYVFAKNAKTDTIPIHTNYIFKRTNYLLDIHKMILKEKCLHTYIMGRHSKVTQHF